MTAESNRPMLAKWRSDTPGTAHRVHLNNAGAALMPSPVIDACKSHLDLESEIGGYEASDAKADEISSVSYTKLAAEIEKELARVAKPN